MKNKKDETYHSKRLEHYEKVDIVIIDWNGFHIYLLTVYYALTNGSILKEKHNTFLKYKVIISFFFIVF